MVVAGDGGCAWNSICTVPPAVHVAKLIRSASSKRAIQFGASRMFLSSLKGVDQHLQLLLISKAISCPTRVYILSVLGPEGRTVTDAAEMAGISIGAASYHLRRLVAAGLARMQRRGRTHVYRWGRDRWFLMCQQADDLPTMGAGQSAPTLPTG